MSEDTTKLKNPDTGSFKMLRAMVGIGIVCALLIVLMYEGTMPRIKQLKAEALEQAIFKVLPGISSTKAFQLNSNNTFSILEGEVKDQRLVYAGYDENGTFKGVAIEAKGQGYADIISVLYGYNPESQKIVGLYVLESKETPGLGDKIEKDANFKSNFVDMEVTVGHDLSSLVNQIITVKTGEKKQSWEIDGITGATISSRAIGALLNASTNEMIPLVYKQKESFNPLGK